MYDEISVDCFSFNQKYNPFLFIELLTQKDISLSFVITKREFINTNWFILSLSFCEEDYRLAACRSGGVRDHKFST